MQSQGCGALCSVQIWFTALNPLNRQGRHFILTMVTGQDATMI